MFYDDKYSKFYNLFKKLSKADMGVQDALNAVRQLHPEAAHALARHIYTDQMVPKVGNAFAYRDFLTRHGNSGVHLSIDGNGVSSLNKIHGFESGDEGIKHLFNTISEVSRKHGLKAFRIGGDEARLHAPTPEKAEAFTKELKQALDSAPVIPGTNHRITAAIGTGYSPEHAEKALIHAKDKLGPLVGHKRQKTHLPGAEPTVDHSLLHESPPEGWTPHTGEIPKLHYEQGPYAAPPEGLKYANPLKP